MLVVVPNIIWFASVVVAPWPIAVELLCVALAWAPNADESAPVAVEKAPTAVFCVPSPMALAPAPVATLELLSPLALARSPVAVFSLPLPLALARTPVAVLELGLALVPPLASAELPKAVLVPVPSPLALAFGPQAKLNALKLASAQPSPSSAFFSRSKPCASENTARNF
jgi:hypothetical protein